MSRFCKAIDRVQRRLQFEQGASGSLNAAIEDVFVREGGKLVRIALSDVSNFEAQGDYVLSHIGDRSLMLHTTMKALMERLPSHQFVRIHRSHIVSIRAIADIEDMSLVLRNGTVLPIGQSYRQALLKVLYTL
jgi:DNA-binding LytR/AlgR family response regulator